MGVRGLWELLAPVGRRVSVETLAGKRLAIDASIWMIQFMKAMRDEKGEMVRNAHILGFFRRICKLLYLRTKPVFVFDGGTPALKRRTVIARRRQRDNAQAKIRKTAEKLLLNHLKAMRLKELAAELEKQRQENDVKGKRVIVEEEPSDGQQGKEKGNDDGSYSQEKMDEMLAASLAAEENEGFSVDASTSGAGVADDVVFGDGEEDDDEDEEMILPEMHGKIDPAILASLPPSMQLDLLVQMRERLMAENRQKYQRVKKAPAKFSELQIEAYLKTVAFRREIDGVQKSAAGRGLGGIQTSRIASEAHREFIFSSSFTGDKQALTEKEKVGADQCRALPVKSSTNSVNKVASTERSDGSVAPTADKTGKKSFHDDVETYLDDRGRLRVSRVRALGIRMTRDLQRNLDLMKEIDQETVDANQEKNNESSTHQVDVLSNLSDRIQHPEINDENNDEIGKTELPEVVNGTSVEICLENVLQNEDGNDDIDKLFAGLVAGNPVMDFSVDNLASGKQPLHSALDTEWEEGVVEGKSKVSVSDEGEVEWEEGSQDIQLKSTYCPDESQKIATMGAMEEEADFQEAIRRSLVDTRDVRLVDDFLEDKISGKSHFHEDDMVGEDDNGEKGHEVEGSATDASQPFDSTNVHKTNCSEAKSDAFIESNSGNSNLDMKILEDKTSEKSHLHEDEMVGEDVDGVSVYDKGEEGHEVEASANDVNQPFGSENVDKTNCSEAKSAEFTETERGNSNLDMSSVIISGEKGLCVPAKQALDNRSEDGNAGVAFERLDDLSTAKLGKTSGDVSITDIDGERESVKEKMCGNFSMGKDEVAGSSSFIINDNKEHEILEDHLEEEMMFLDKEREELGDEQRKLERNAESVSNEMFAECQELLQMFGLPYIIAPMEAEAQCAFMELSNLVDGVVTDDSDAFLFGARNVYKNIFDDRKYVETYLMKDIENELGLDREKLIHMALLLGSDYTEGISGIGIVNAIEVVNAFPGKDGLREFREWIESPDPSIFGKLNVEAGSSTKRKGSKGNGNMEVTSCDQNAADSVDDAKRIQQIFMDKHRNVSKNWHISSSFPSDAVISAYEYPQVDKSMEPFSWGKPDLFVLRKLCWEKLGWGSSKADELLLPVLKEYNKHETQLRLEAFYTFNERFAKIRSKRIKKAVKGITGGKSSELMDDKTQPQSGKKRKAKPNENEANQSGVGSVGLGSAGISDQNNTMDKPIDKQLKRGRTKEKTSQRNYRGRGRGPLSRRGGRRKKDSSCDDTETSHDSREGESDEEMQFGKKEESRQVRRSGRFRKTVNYSVSDEFDNCDKESEDCLQEVVTDQEKPFVDQIVDAINERDKSELHNVGKEGRAFMEETEETDKVDDTPMDEPSNQSQSSKVYLQFGGGFCMDEDEEMEDTNGHASCPSKDSIPQKSDVEENGGSKRNPSIIIGETDLSGAELNMNEKTPATDNDSPDDIQNDSYSRSLRAMPNLRRKRRKK